MVKLGTSTLTDEPVAAETSTPGWGLGTIPAYTVVNTGKIRHDRGRYVRPCNSLVRSRPSYAGREASLIKWRSC